MKLIVKILYLLLFSSSIFGQKVDVMQQGVESDSSFYHIEKINDNEFWAGGEYGILKKIDSLGNVSSLNFPNEGIDILKIQRVKSYVFILTADAVIYRYDIETKAFFKKEFPEFKNRCFYDLLELDNGTLLVCGGTSGIAIAEKKIPNGFIATIDENLKNINVVWKSKRKFVWSMSSLDGKNVLAVTFNGINSQIIKSEDLKSWKKDIKIKGLVHEIRSIDGVLWYCGTTSIHFEKTGIVGHATEGKKQSRIDSTGCLWSLNEVGGKIIAVTQSGELLKIDKKGREIHPVKGPKSFTLYGFEKISESKILVIGHGKTFFIIDLKDVFN